MKHVSSFSQKFIYQLTFRIFFSLIIAMCIALAVFFTFIIPEIQNGLMEKKREMIKELVYLAYNEMQAAHENYISGKISLPEAQQQVINHIKSLRYGPENKDYFWINDMHPTMIMHPYRQDLDGEDLSTFQDHNGKFLFQAFVDEVSKNSEGYVDYMWQWKDDSHKIVPKISFVKEFQPWGWIIGTGIYIEDVKKEISQTLTKIIFIVGAVFIFVVAIFSYVIMVSFKGEKKKNEAEQKLLEKEKQYQEFMLHTHIGIFRRSKEGKIMMANPALYKILGCRFGDEENIQEVFSYVHEQNNVLPTSLESKKIIHKEIFLTKKDGNSLWISLTIRAKCDKKGDIEYFDGVLEDITERKILEEKTKELDTKKSEFLAIASHELRTPLTSMKGYLDMILDGDYGEISAPAQETLGGIYKNADRLIHLVNDMLDITKLEAGKMEFHKETFTINEVLEDIYHTYKNIAGEKKIHFGIHLHKNVHIQNDKQKLSQVVINLLSNAFKFTFEGGKVELKTQVRQNKIQIMISDTGVGIDTKDFEVIFSKFGQLNNILSDKQKGTGLGLAIVKETLVQMGSNIDLSSQIGKGSIFSFELDVVSDGE